MRLILWWRVTFVQFLSESFLSRLSVLCLQGMVVNGFVSRLSLCLQGMMVSQRLRQQFVVVVLAGTVCIVSVVVLARTVLQGLFA